MTQGGHTLAGACVSIALAVLFWDAHPQAAACAIAGITAGANAPDWIEKPLMLRHRTWTHWPVWWLALLAASLPAMIFSPLPCLTAGFAVGALLHLALDIGTPTGIPLRWPPDGRRRRSLYLYTTGSPAGEAAALAVVVACCALPVALHGLFMRYQW